MVSRMKRILAAIFLMVAGSSVADEVPRADLETAYTNWREAIIRKDSAAWQRATAPHRRVEVRNRIVSEKRSFPAAVFDLPAPPPSLNGLKFLEASRKGGTAKASYFGKVDFGVGGQPTDNLLVLSFVSGGQGWLYDRADFVNLTALPAVRKELAAGDLNYLHETPETKPSGVVPPTPQAVAAVPYLARVYVFCPGREVKVHVNKVSQHRFANAKEAETVIGGALDGMNEVQFSTRKLDGAKGGEAMTIRVYVLSQVAGVKPIKVYEYQVAEGGQAKPFGSGSFFIDARMSGVLKGKP